MASTAAGNPAGTASRGERMGPNRRRARVDATHARILEATERLVTAGAPGAFSMDDVAREAGVARATVYEHFGTKPRLLGALVETVARDSALPLDDAARAPDPVAAARIIVQHAGSHWDRHATRIREARELSALAGEASDASPANVDRAALRELGDRLFRGGHLRPPWTAGEAAAALGVLTSFETFSGLRDGGLDNPAIGTVLLRMADTMFASPPGSANG